MGEVLRSHLEVVENGCDSSNCERYRDILELKGVDKWSDLPADIEHQISFCDGVPCMLTTRDGRKLLEVARLTQVETVHGVEDA